MFVHKLDVILTVNYSESRKMEIVIVGGGVMGLLSALVLVQAKCKVAILEKNAGALESSWAGGVIVSPMGKTLSTTGYAVIKHTNS